MFAEVIDNTEFDYLQSQIQLILTNAVGYNATSWSRKLFGNGSGGYYMAIPDNVYGAIPAIQELVSGYPQFSSLPSVVPPNTFTALSITDDVVYAIADFTNLGKIATAAVLSEAYLLDYGGIKRIILGYRDGQVVIVNTNDGTYHYYNSGFEKPWKPIYIASRNELVFIISTSANIFKISLTSNTITYTTVNGVTIPSTASGMQNRCLGTDNNIYFGTNTDARVFKFNPATNALTALGQQYTGGSTYVYDLGGDADYCYTLLRQNGNYWISVINTSTLAHYTIGNPTDGFRAGDLILYSNGVTKFWHFSLRLSSVGLSDISKDFVNGVDTPGLVPVTNLFQTEQNGYLSYYQGVPANWPTLFSIETNFDRIDGINGDCEIDYKVVGAPMFTTLALPEVTKNDLDLLTVQPDLSGNLLGSHKSYGPVFKWNTTLDAIDQIHNINVSVYALLEFSANKVFIGGYANRTYEWDPSTAWDFLINPFKIDFDVANAFYHYFYAQSGDWLYSGQDISRNDSGACICMYNPTTLEIIVADATQIASLQNYGVSHLFTINGGNKLVLIGRPIKSSIYPRVFVWDISSNKNVNELTPVSFDLNLTGLYGGFGFPVATDTFIGFNSNVVYKVVLSPFSITYRNLPSALYPLGFYFRSVAQKADGSIVFLAASGGITYLYELDPVLFTAKRKSSTLGTITYNRGLSIANGKLYAYGGNTSISQFGGANNKYFLEKLTL